MCPLFTTCKELTPLLWMKDSCPIYTVRSLVPRFLSWLVSTFIFRIQVWQVCSVLFDDLIWYYSYFRSLCIDWPYPPSVFVVSILHTLMGIGVRGTLDWLPSPSMYAKNNSKNTSGIRSINIQRPKIWIISYLIIKQNRTYLSHFEMKYKSAQQSWHTYISL